MEKLGTVLRRTMSETGSRKGESTALPKKYELSSNIDETVSCIYCRDITWVHPVINGIPDYSRVIDCPQCSAQRAAELAEQRAVGLSGIPAPKQRNTFATFRKNPANEDAYNTCLALAQGKLPQKIVLVYGNYGNGKTHLAYATGIEAIKIRRARTLYKSVAGLLAEIKGQMGSGSGPEFIIQGVQGADFLVLDDWGANRDTEFVAETLERIVGYRYDNELPTLITTNVDIKALPSRLRSVLSDLNMCLMVQNKDVDRRRTPVPANTQATMTPEAYR